ncbi:MAG: TlpA disulfide reductase family protein [Caulobacter sp.]
MQRRELMAALAATGAATGLAAPSLTWGQDKQAAVGDVAPPFSVTTFDHEVIKSSEMFGDVVVLNYWATWCGPCRAEMPAMDRFMRERKGAGLRIYAITVESAPPEQALRDLAKVLSFPLAKQLIGKGYGKIDNAVPTSFVIDRRGVVRHADSGGFTYSSFSKLLKPLLAEPRPVSAKPPKVA